MKAENLLLVFAIIAVLVSFVNISISLTKLAQLKSTMLGYATGTVWMRVEASIAINFTDDMINWSSGAVTYGQTAAVLNTSTNSVTYGNWTAESTGLTLENIGNVNASINILSGDTNASLLGGTSPKYLWNISNSEANSCATIVAGFANYTDVNTTSPGTRICSVFEYLNARDVLRVDISLTVPYDSLTGAISDTITATATAV